jgi:dihydrodipicolinate synthase/N-acetylneuraminate lyase
MPLDRNFEGVVVALMTPFDGEGNVDIKKTGELVNYLAGTGLRLVCGWDVWRRA